MTTHIKLVPKKLPDSILFGDIPIGAWYTTQARSIGGYGDTPVLFIKLSENSIFNVVQGRIYTDKEFIGGRIVNNVNISYDF